MSLEKSLETFASFHPAARVLRRPGSRPERELALREQPTA